MSDRALQAASEPQELLAARASELETLAEHITEVIDWDKVQAMAVRAPALPPTLATYVGDARVRAAFHAWCASPVVAAVTDGLVVAAVAVEASAPHYLELPAVLAAFAGDARYVEARPLGRVLYRMLLYVEDEVGQFVYAPVCFSRGEVFEVIDGMVRLRDRRLAVTTPLSWRVGFAVGFLSALSVAQADEAQAGMVILAGLVAPLLEPRAGVGDRAMPKRSRGKRKGKRARRSAG